MLYKKNSEQELSRELFQQPTAEYRGTPFWAWNNMLTKEELCRQIDVFKEMGLGGFHMHVRTGLKNEYLSDEYMELVRACVDKAKNEKMLAWLYDEDRWPSGAAGGIVTQEEKYRARNLLFTNKKNAAAHFNDDSCAAGGRSNKGQLLACYDVILDAEGYLLSYKKIRENEQAEGQKWFALLEIHQPSGWYNDKTYVDTLSKEAIERFVEVTHKKYKETVGDEFDQTVPAIFTDEPQFSRKQTLRNSVTTQDTDICMPWTDKVPELYKEAYGADIMETLPELFWDLPDGKVSVARYHYHDFIAELFATSFADTVGDWCRENGIYLTGHMMEEPSLGSQTAALGEAMRSYRSFGIPGIDMLCNRHEFTTAKQAQSAAHQFGYEGVLSELYGVTGWDCDFRTYKHQGDWQAALGITVRVPHLSWYAMAGEAKRDYPASIHYQSPWYKEYAAVEDHFARVNTAMTRGKPVVKVAVIHPVESYWLHWGPNDHSMLFRADVDDRFSNLTQWLLEGSVDFDFISESLFPALCEKANAPLTVGKMTYDTVIVPGCETLRSTTLERLEDFRAAGGKLIFLGSAPTLENAVPSERGAELFNKSQQVEFSRSALLTALDNCRTLTIRYADGRLADSFLYQLRKDNDAEWLFICPDKEPDNKDLCRSSDLRIILNGEFGAEEWNTENGTIKPLAVTYANGKTVIEKTLFGYDSLLLKLTEGKQEIAAADDEEPEFRDNAAVAEKVSYTLSEDNALLLDLAEFKLDSDTGFSPEEEILRLDNICRERLGFRRRGGQVVQPWALPKEEATHAITLKFTFDSEIGYEGAILALEDADKAKIVFNGTPVSNTSEEYFADITIAKVALPAIIKGTNELLVTLPFGKRTNTEAMFILGKFGVKINGRKAVITALPEKIGFGDLTAQGFPFFGGNITYHLKAVSKGGKLNVQASDYRGALISVAVDGKKAGRIIYPPYILTINDLPDGEHNVDVTLFTHRYNQFGPLHLVNVKESWHGPGAWRSTDENWSYEYVLRSTGLLKSPLFG